MVQRGPYDAHTLTEYASRLGIEMQVGLHTGECEITDGKVGGIGAAIGVQVANKAAPGEVIVSATVKDLVAGSGIIFDDQGTHQFPNIPGEWRYSVRT
jgi:class 3 adenylate cyclase